MAGMVATAVDRLAGWENLRAPVSGRGASARVCLDVRLARDNGANNENI